MSGANYTRVWEIHSLLHPKPDDLISTSRFFVREGELQIWDEKRRRKRKRYFFLFNDILLLTKRESHKRYWLRIHITLRSPYVAVEDIESASYTFEFRLHCRSRSFILYAPSPDIRKEWIEDLQKSISGSHKEELENKKIQEMTRELHKNTDDVVKEAPKEKRDKKPKEVKKEEDDEEEQEKETIKQKPKPAQERTKSVGGEQIKKKKTKKKEKEGDLLGPLGNMKMYDWTAPGGGGLTVPNQPPAYLIQSSPGQFGGTGGADMRAGLVNPFAPAGASPFAGDLFGVSTGASHLTGSLSGPSGGQPYGTGGRAGSQQFSSGQFGSAQFGGQTNPNQNPLFF